MSCLGFFLQSLFEQAGHPAVARRTQDRQSLELRSQELGAGAKSPPKSAQFLGSSWRAPLQTSG